MMRQAALLGMLAVVCVFAEEDEAAPLDVGQTAAPTFSNQVSAAGSQTTLNGLATAGDSLDVVSASGTVVRMQSVQTSTTKANGDVNVDARYTGSVADWDAGTRVRAAGAVAVGLNVAADRVQVADVVATTGRSAATAGRTAEAEQTFVLVTFLVLNSRPYAIILPVPTAHHDDGLSDGAIAGIVVGCVVGAGLIAFLVVWFCCCQDEDTPEEKNESANTGADTEGGSATGANHEPNHEPNHGEDAAV